MSTRCHALGPNISLASHVADSRFTRIPASAQSSTALTSSTLLSTASQYATVTFLSSNHGNSGSGSSLNFLFWKVSHALSIRMTFSNPVCWILVYPRTCAFASFTSLSVFITVFLGSSGFLSNSSGVASLSSVLVTLDVILNSAVSPTNLCRVVSSASASFHIHFIFSYSMASCSSSAVVTARLASSASCRAAASSLSCFFSSTSVRTLSATFLRAAMVEVSLNRLFGPVSCRYVDTYSSFPAYLAPATA